MTKILHRLTGGRPMHSPEFRFTDVVSGRPVFKWRDQFDRQWLAEGAWSLFRVPKS